MTTKIDELVITWRELGPTAWAEGPFGFTMENGKPIQLTPWQRAALDSYWNHAAEITTWAVSNVKKTGKTQLNAVLTAWRWLALPGQHFTAANDLDQSQARQFGMIVEMVRRNQYLSQVVKIGKSEMIFEPTGSRLTALASDATGNAGANFITTSHTEAWGILYEGGIRAWEELTPPPGKWYGLPALRIADSSAGYLGESATWHKLVDRGLGGKRISGEWPIYQAGGLLLFHIEGEEARRRCFRGTPGEALLYYTEQRESLRPNSFDRIHNNQRTAAESAFLPEGAWARAESFDVKPIRSGERARLVLGVDASTTRDLTAMVGVEYNQETNTTDVRLVRVWKPERGLLRLGKPTVDLAETLGAAVMDLHKAGQVAAVVADPYQLHSLILEWEKAGIRVIELAQNAGRVEADQGLYDSIVSLGLRHYGDPTLTEHITNAVAVETPRGFRLAKEKTSKKIDAAVALSMANWGAMRSQKGGGYVISMPNPFYENVPSENLLYDRFGNARDAGAKVNRRPHPAGVTWRNCPHNNRGCQACVDEMEADGTADQLRKDDELAEQQAELNWNPVPPLWQESRLPPEAIRAEQTVKTFWENVKKRSNQ